MKTYRICLENETKNVLDSLIVNKTQTTFLFLTTKALRKFRIYN